MYRYRILAAAVWTAAMSLIVTPAHAQLVVSNSTSVKDNVDWTRCEADERSSRNVYATRRFKMHSSERKQAAAAFDRFLRSRGIAVGFVNCGYSAYGNDDSQYDDKVLDNGRHYHLVSWTGGFEVASVSSRPTRPSRTGPATAENPVAPRVPDYELKYQREMAEYRRKVAERDARIREIEAQKKARAAQLQASHQRAVEAMQAHNRDVAKADAAQRDYEQRLAEHRRVVESLNQKPAKDLKKLDPVEWREAVSVCSLEDDNPQSKFGNWRCTGPLQFTYVKLGADGTLFDTKARAQMSLTCGGSSSSIRDLGRSGGYRVFGCGFGLHPTETNGLHIDAARKYGLDYIPGRQTYHCPAVVSSCRTL